jgi:hypothetical protein
MRYRIHGRLEVEVVRDHDRWLVFRVGAGTRVADHEIAIPVSAEPGEITIFPDDIFHELAGPGTAIRQVEK